MGVSGMWASRDAKSGGGTKSGGASKAVGAYEVDVEELEGRECHTSAFGFRVSGFEFRVSSFGSRVSDSRFWGPGSGSRVSCLRSKVSGLGFRVSGFGLDPRREPPVLHPPHPQCEKLLER